METATIVALVVRCAIAVTLAIGGIVALLLGLKLHKDRKQEPDDSILEIQKIGLKWQASGIGATLMITSFLWAWLSYLSSPSLTDKGGVATKENPVATDQNRVAKKEKPTEIVNLAPTGVRKATPDEILQYIEKPLQTMANDAENVVSRIRVGLESIEGVQRGNATTNELANAQRNVADALEASAKVVRSITDIISSIDNKDSMGRLEPAVMKE